VARAPERRHFGQITRLPSGRCRARYADPERRKTDRGEPLRHNAPYTFAAKSDAEARLVDERRLVTSGAWTSPAGRLTDSARRLRRSVNTRPNGCRPAR